MTPEQQRMAIAEACGWKMVEQDVAGHPDNPFFSTIPDYLNDLNAMHEAESKALRDGHSYWKFIELLDGLVKHGEHVDFVADRASATAAQRAETFLRTLNLWVED
jgi:hypothetical protein